MTVFLTFAEIGKVIKLKIVIDIIEAADSREERMTDMYKTEQFNFLQIHKRIHVTDDKTNERIIHYNYNKANPIKYIHSCNMQDKWIIPCSMLSYKG